MPRLRWPAVLGAIVLAGACQSTSTSSLPGSVAPASMAPASPVSSPLASPSAALPTTPGPTTRGPFPRLDLQTIATVSGGPLAITSPRDGSGRLFVAAQDGRAWVIANGKLRSDPLLDIRDRVTSGGEQGLLGIAVHPGFPTDRRVFVDYTNRAGDTVVASFAIDPANPDQVDPSSGHIVFTTDQPFPNHNGGAIVFGPDGDLYISLGDGGSEGDPQGNGQNLGTPLAKILRIDVDHQANGHAYAIPPDNPFVGAPHARPETWLYGLRNPWRISFDRQSGDLWIGDVGQDRWEEIDVARAGTSGLNFGWNTMEASHCYDPPTACSRSGLTLPVAEYSHDLGCAVIGGNVYLGTAYPAFVGLYVFSDDCSGRLFAIDAAVTSLTKPTQVGSAGPGVAGFGEDEAGEIYLAKLDGTVARLTASQP